MPCVGSCASQNHRKISAALIFAGSKTTWTSSRSHENVLSASKPRILYGFPMDILGFLDLETKKMRARMSMKHDFFGSFSDESSWKDFERQLQYGRLGRCTPPHTSVWRRYPATSQHRSPLSSFATTSHRHLLGLQGVALHLVVLKHDMTMSQCIFWNMRVAYGK